jgi:hypothetical protein
MSRTAICISSIAALLLAGTVSVARANVYRWVGKHGVVHFSDQWRPGAVRIRTETGTPAASSTSATHAQDSVAAEVQAANRTLEHRKAERSVAAVEARLRAKRCQEAKAVYQHLLYARRLYTVGKNGHRHYMTSAQDDAARIKAHEEMDRLCGSGSNSSS